MAVGFFCGVGIGDARKLVIPSEWRQKWLHLGKSGYGRNKEASAQYLNREDAPGFHM